MSGGNAGSPRADETPDDGAFDRPTEVPVDGPVDGPAPDDAAPTDPAPADDATAALPQPDADVEPATPEPPSPGGLPQPPAWAVPPVAEPVAEPLAEPVAEPVAEQGALTDPPAGPDDAAPATAVLPPAPADPEPAAAPQSDSEPAAAVAPGDPAPAEQAPFAAPAGPTPVEPAPVSPPVAPVDLTQDVEAPRPPAAEALPAPTEAGTAAAPAAPATMGSAPLSAEPLTTEPSTTEPSTTEPDDSATGAAADRDATTASGGSRLGRVPAAVLAALALLAVLGTGYLAWQVRQESLTDTARSEGLEAARDAARVLFSYDHSKLEEDFAAGMELTTGDFREEYERTTREVVTPVATQYDAVVEAEVVEAAVVSVQPDRLVALVYVNQSTTSTRVEGPKIDQSRVRMSLRRDGDQWLVEKVDAL